MKTVAVVCEKGGTGKTAISREIYLAARRRGVRASLYSLDGQYEDTAGDTKDGEAELAVVDTPGVLAENLRELIGTADLVVVPVRPTPADVEPFTRTLDIVGGLTDAPVLVVVNGWNRWRMCAAFMEWAGSKEWGQLMGVVPQSEAMVQAWAANRSVVEVAPRGSCAAAVRTVCDAAFALVGLDAREPVPEWERRDQAGEGRHVEATEEADEVG